MSSSETPEIKIIHRYIAYGSVGASTVRGLGQKGVVAAAREALRKVDLGGYCKDGEKMFRKTLDADTKRIMCKLPDRAQHWGVARKVLNIFLRGSLYNTYLNAHYELGKLETFFEIPLDKLSAAGIKELANERPCPRWIGVKHLEPAVNQRFQQIATEIASEKKTHRVHLDAIFWGGR